jgi:hypothetical protein
LDALGIRNLHNSFHGIGGDGLNRTGFGAHNAGKATGGVNFSTTQSQTRKTPAQDSVGTDKTTKRARNKNTQRQHNEQHAPRKNIAN